jgi:hypothetical protein
MAWIYRTTTKVASSNPHLAMVARMEMEMGRKWNRNGFGGIPVLYGML